jgi:pimeloyl-ACP methyl ester carboxylesterase
VIQTGRSPTRTDDSGRARLPDRSGYATAADGVRLAYDLYGSGDPTLLFVPSAPIVHSRQWKGQVPYFSRRHRVLTYDGRGNGLSDRPTTSEAYHDDLLTSDITAVMDATETERAVLIGLCGDGVWRAIRTAAEHPDRVLGIVAFAVGVPRIAPPQDHYVAASATFDDELTVYEGWSKFNRHYWRRDYADWVRFFFGEITSEAHSTKTIDDAVRWALDADVESMIAEAGAEIPFDLERIEATCRAVQCPMLLVHGTDDTCQRPARALRLAELTGAPLVLVAGANHMIPGRHPVLANLLIRDFIRSLPEASNDGR